MLDEFEMYRPRHSFYFSDDELPNLLSIEVGTGLGTRKHVADRYDPHAETIETGNGTSLVVKIFDASVPVYADIGRARAASPSLLTAFLFGHGSSAPRI